MDVGASDEEDEEAADEEEEEEEGRRMPRDGVRCTDAGRCSSVRASTEDEEVEGPSPWRGAKLMWRARCGEPAWRRMLRPAAGVGETMEVDGDEG